MPESAFQWVIFAVSVLGTLAMLPLIIWAVCDLIRDEWRWRHP